VNYSFDTKASRSRYTFESYKQMKSEQRNLETKMEILKTKIKDKYQDTRKKNIEDVFKQEIDGTTNASVDVKPRPPLKILFSKYKSYLKIPIDYDSNVKVNRKRPNTAIAQREEIEVKVTAPKNEVFKREEFLHCDSINEDDFAKDLTLI